MIRNLPQVTKNLLILNILFWLASLVLASSGIDLIGELGAYYFNSPNFKPYQIVTHFFMHSIGTQGQISIWHILMNMFLLLMFGAHLERVWGSKRFFIFYVASAMGALVLYNSIGIIQIAELKSTLSSLGYNISDLNYNLTHNKPFPYSIDDEGLLTQYATMINTPMVGASGAIFGLLAGFAMLFPNIQLMLLFPPIPIKAKYLIGGYIAFEVYSSFNMSGDHIAHLAHVGGAIVGILFILVWRKKDRGNTL